MLKYLYVHIATCTYIHLMNVGLKHEEIKEEKNEYK